MFTKEERLFIWKKVYEMIDWQEDGEYICVALRNVVFMYFKKHKNIYEFRSDEMVRIYFPELEEKIGMATEPEETRTFYGWFGCISPETKEVRLNIVKDIVKDIRIVFLLIYFIHQIKFLGFGMSVRENRHVYFCIIEEMTRRAGMYVSVLVRFWAFHKQ